MKITQLFLVISLITFTSSLEALQLYRNNSRIEQNITALLEQFPNVQQEHCQNDEKIKYIVFGDGKAKIKAIISCNVHAHQLITAQLCVDFANQIVRQHSPLLKQIQFTVIYIGNQVRQSVFDGNFCVRTNENNVDINRNFPQGFTYINGGQNYSGQQPLSETYTQCLDKMANKIKPTIYLDIHSGQFSLVYYKKDDSQPEDSSLPILQKIKERYCKNCRLENVRPLNMNGQAFEYLKYKYHVKYSNLLQIYGGFSANQILNDHCFTIFNPLTERQLRYFLDKWTQILAKYFQFVLQQQAKNHKLK